MIRYIVNCNKDGTINYDDERNTWGVSAYFHDNVNGSATSASVSNGGIYAYSNALGTVCVSDSCEDNAPERLFLGNEKHLTDPTDDKCQTRTAVEVEMGSTRLNGWKYDTVFVHNATEVSIIHMLAHEPDPQLLAVFKGVSNTAYWDTTNSA